jgi:hypothetical protein
LIFSGGSFVPFCGISEVNFYAKSENGMIEKYKVLRDVFNKMSICKAYWLLDLVLGIHPSFAG